jgi:hypothetical protein
MLSLLIEELDEPRALNASVARDGKSGIEATLIGRPLTTAAMVDGRAWMVRNWDSFSSDVGKSGKVGPSTGFSGGVDMVAKKGMR